MLVVELSKKDTLSTYNALGMQTERNVLYSNLNVNVNYILDGELRASKNSMKVHGDDFYLVSVREKSEDNKMTAEQYDKLNKTYFQIRDGLYVKIIRYTTTSNGKGVHFKDTVNNIFISSKEAEFLLDRVNINDLTVSVYSEQYPTLVTSTGLEFETKPNTLEHKECVQFTYYLDGEKVVTKQSIITARKIGMMFTSIKDFTDTKRNNFEDVKEVRDREIEQLKISLQNSLDTNRNQILGAELLIRERELELKELELDKKILTVDIIIEETIANYFIGKNVMYSDIDEIDKDPNNRLELLKEAIDAIYEEEDGIGYFDFVAKMAKDIYKCL